MDDKTALTWREARDALTESGHRDVNSAQYILEDLAHWGPERSFSYQAGGEVRWLSYAGPDPADHQPRYRSSSKRVT